MTADISSKVAEKALCWCEGRRARAARLKKLFGEAVDIPADSTWHEREAGQQHLSSVPD
jgi:hypothetical protein